MQDSIALCGTLRTVAGTIGAWPGVGLCARVDLGSDGGPAGPTSRPPSRPQTFSQAGEAGEEERGGGTRRVKERRRTYVNPMTPPFRPMAMPPSALTCPPIAFFLFLPPRFLLNL